MKKTAPITTDPISTSSLSGQRMTTHGQAPTAASTKARRANCQGGGMRMRPSPTPARPRPGSLAAGQIPPTAHQACAAASRASTSESATGRVMSDHAGSLTLHFPGQQRQIADAHQQTVWRIVPPVARGKRFVTKMAAPRWRITRDPARHEHAGDAEGDGLDPGQLVAAEQDERPQRHQGEHAGHRMALPGGRHAPAAIAHDAACQCLLIGLGPVVAQAPPRMDDGEHADAEEQQDGEQHGHERNSRVYWVSWLSEHQSSKGVAVPTSSSEVTASAASVACRTAGSSAARAIWPSLWTSGTDRTAAEIRLAVKACR